jgi:predicted double-glycine peptidase
MTYAYGQPVSEKDVFEKMFAQGDQDKIRKEGFSMLDMSRYLNAHGLNAKGYKITERVIEDHKLPVIALVNNNGYNHFVVVKTISGNRVLVGDPNTGNTEYTQADFAKIWNGVALVVTNETDKARVAYNNEDEWRFTRAHAPIRDGNDAGIESAELPAGNWQIAPIAPNILPVFAIGASVSPAVGGGL